MKSRRSIGLILLALTALPLSSPAGEANPTDDLSRLVETAISRNPELKGSQARWEMFRSRVDQVRSLDDPMLMFKVQSYLLRDPFDSRRDPMSQRVIGISQQLPFWGKRDLRGEAASLEADSLRWQVEERKLELARMVKETWYRIFLADRELDLIEKNIRIMDDFITIADTKYSVGQGTQQDLLKARVERSRMLDMKISLEQRRRSLQATLNTLLSRPAETPVGRVPDFGLKPFTWSAEQLRAMAWENRPMLRSLKALVEKGEVGRRLAEKESFPDVNISLEYMQRDPVGEMEPGYDMYSLGLTFNLPIQRERRRAMVRESTAEIAMANAELDALRNSIDLGIADGLARLERYEREATLYRTGIIPQAEQSLESATIGYRVNKVDFLTLLDNRLTLFNYEREYYEALTEYQMGKAQLEALVGKELD